MFNRKKIKEQLAKTSRKQTHYNVKEGDAVELRLYGVYENGTVKTPSGSYFIASTFVTDPDIVLKKLETKIGKHV